MLLTRTGQLADLRPSDRLDLFLEQGPILVTSPDFLAHARVSGSGLTVEHMRLLTALKLLNQTLTSLYTQRQALAGQPGEEMTVPRVNEQITRLNQQLSHELAAYVKAHPASYVSLAALQQLGGQCRDAPWLSPFTRP